MFGLRKVTTAAVLSAGLVAGTMAQAENIEWASGSPGGSWFSIVTGLANIVMEANPDINIRVVPGGGRDNPSLIEGGISQMGMGIDFLAAAAYAGKAPYDKPNEKLTSLGGQWAPAEFHVIADSADTRSFAEIFSDPKLRVGTSPKATSEELTLQRVLEFYGNTDDKIAAAGGTVINGTYTQLISAYQDNQIDVLWGAGSYPTGIALEVETGRRVAKVMAFPQDLMVHLQTEFGYGIGTIPAGTYAKLQSDGEATPVTTMEAIIMISKDVSDDTAYRITKAMLEHQDSFAAIYQVLGKFDPKLAWQNQPIPLNEGAAKAYKELGYMD